MPVRPFGLEFGEELQQRIARLESADLLGTGLLGGVALRRRKFVRNRVRENT